MINTWLKIVVGISVIVVTICIILVINVIKPINLNNDVSESEVNETTKYNFESKLEDLHLEKKEDYLEYLLEVSRKIEPKKLQKLVVIDNNVAAVYKNSYFAQKENGEQVLRELTADAYCELLCRVIKRGEDWSELPLTKHFREKFNPEIGIITHPDYTYYDDLYTYLHNYSYTKKEFAVNCKNSDNNYYSQVYSFVLDDKGYLDDIIFLRNDYEEWDFINNE